MKKYILDNIIGTKFERLIVIDYAPAQNRHQMLKVKCVCEAGTIKIVRYSDLISKQTKSCGCLNAENHPTIHGMRHYSEYNSWNSMKRRCSDKAGKDHKYYKGKGITVCERWLNSMTDFYADMGPKPTPEHSIHRINNDLGYSPENCKWADKKEQAQNKSKSIKK